MSDQGLKSQVKKVFTGSEIQGSLFHPERAENGSAEKLSVREILSLLKPSLKEPSIQGSLFTNGAAAALEDSELVQVSPELLERLAQRRRGIEPNFIPSLFTDFAELGEELKRDARRKRLLASISILAHISLVGFVIYIAASRATAPPTKPKDVVMIMPNVPLPPMLKVPGDNKPGGGGGGGGRQAPTPPSQGRLPRTSPMQLVPPDPTPMPQQDSMIAEPTIVLPIEIPQKLSLPLGDPSSITAPPSSGPGRGSGIGTGEGTGVGSGKGRGFGPGEGEGMGGGKGRGIGSGIGDGIAGPNTAGVRAPVLLRQDLPPYTEDARRNKITGIVVLNVVIKRDGTVDSPRVVRGLGHGLDESAVQSVLTKWRFRPAILNGQPVDFNCNIEVTFNIL